jgi:hypothetical protein
MLLMMPRRPRRHECGNDGEDLESNMKRVFKCSHPATGFEGKIDSWGCTYGGSPYLHAQYEDEDEDKDSQCIAAACKYTVPAVRGER